MGDFLYVVGFFVLLVLVVLGVEFLNALLDEMGDTKHDDNRHKSA